MIGAVARVVAVAVVVATLAMVASLVGRAGDDVEAVTGWTLAVAIAATVLAATGAAVLATSRDRDVTLLATLASLLVVATMFLSIVGLVVLPFTVAALAALRRRTAGRRDIAAALLAGPTIAVGLAALLVVWVQPPLVECHRNGVTTTGRPWWDTTSGSGSGTPGGISTGTIDTPSGSYRYRCEGDRLVEFVSR